MKFVAGAKNKAKIAGYIENIRSILGEADLDLLIKTHRGVQNLRHDTQTIRSGIEAIKDGLSSISSDAAKCETIDISAQDW